MHSPLRPLKTAIVSAFQSCVLVIVVESIVVVGECCLSLWSQVMVHEPSGAAASSTRAGEAKEKEMLAMEEEAW